MSVTQETMFEDLGTEPEENRGVALEKPVTEDPKPEAKDELEGEEPKEEEVAEGHTEAPAEEQDTPEGDQPEGASQKLRAKDFAAEAGWSLEEFYRDVTVPTDEGEVTLSEVVDGYKSLRTENETLRQEQQRLAEQANGAQTQMPPYSPEAVELLRQARDLQHTYDNADWSQVEASERVDQKMQYRDAIERLTRDAQAKQQAYQVELDKHMREVRSKVDAAMRKEIPEWRSDSVRTQERKAMTDFLIAEGADQQRVSMILDGDPWAAKLVRDYWKLKRNEAETKKAIRKVAKVPKSLTPSARVAPKPGNIADAAKALQGAKSRREWDKALASVDLGISPD